ncbi:MAG: hypothetical protein PWQ06_2731, partial [Anaerophaga sp.]|nr:hypothetical protein [Anaerophaga sp.]
LIVNMIVQSYIKNNRNASFFQKIFGENLNLETV